MRISRLILTTVTVMSTCSARFQCSELVTPRVFGGHFKPTEFLSVALDHEGNMLAGGYSQDETIFNKELDKEVEQKVAPILAYYPATNYAEVKVFQIYIWPAALSMGQYGKVAAVSISSSPGPIYHSVLLDQVYHMQPNSGSNFLFALILDQEFQTVVEYEIRYGGTQVGQELASAIGRSIFYRSQDDQIFIFLTTSYQVSAFQLISIENAISSSGNHDVDNSMLLDYRLEFYNLGRVPNFKVHQFHYEGFSALQSYGIYTSIFSGREVVSIAGALVSQDFLWHPTAFLFDPGVSGVSSTFKVSRAGNSETRHYKSALMHSQNELEFVVCLIESQFGQNEFRFDIHLTQQAYLFLGERTAAFSVEPEEQFQATEMTISASDGLVILQMTQDFQTNQAHYYLMAFSKVDSVEVFSRQSTWVKRLSMDSDWRLNMAFMRSQMTEPVLVGSVKNPAWKDSDGGSHTAAEVYEFLDVEKAFILGLHSMCQVFDFSQLAGTEIQFIDSDEQEAGSFEQTESTTGHGYNDFRVLEVWTGEKQDNLAQNIGDVRLFDFNQFTGSQTYMNIDQFRVSIEEDPDFVSEVDELCKNPTNFPYCTNGKYTPPSMQYSPETLCFSPFAMEYSTEVCLYLFDYSWLWQSLNSDALEIKYGMDKRFVEPWFECTVKQLFNDGIKGYIHGQITTYNIFKGAQSQWVRANPLSLSGKFTDKCYFAPLYSELVSELATPEQTRRLQAKEFRELQYQFDYEYEYEQIEDPPPPPPLPEYEFLDFQQSQNEDFMEEVDMSYPTKTLPEFVLARDTLDASKWAAQGGKLLIQTENIKYVDKGVGETLWLGSVISNGQFYQARISVEFTSFCQQMRFYETESHQVVYVSLLGRFPFYYEPQAVRAITPEIERSCKKDEVGQRISLVDEEGVMDVQVAHMMNAKQIGVEGSRFAIYSLAESQRMLSFSVYQVTDYSDYMPQSIWSKIEFRIVCIVQDFNVPAEAYPPNISRVVSYEDFVQGLVFESHQMSKRASTTQSCGYPVTTTLQRLSNRTVKPPGFVSYDAESNTLALEVQAGGNFTLPHEQVFMRHELQLTVQAQNLDMTAFEALDGVKMGANSVKIDSAGQLIFSTVTKSLPFIVQLQELGRENQSPKFETDMVEEIQISPGKLVYVALPRILDAEQDEVLVRVKLDGESLAEEKNGSGADKCTAASCFIELISEQNRLKFLFPDDYLVEKAGLHTDATVENDVSFKQVSVPVFDESGQLQMVVKDTSEMISSKTKKHVAQALALKADEKHLLQIELDDQKSITSYQIDLLIISQRQQSSSAEIQSFEQLVPTPTVAENSTDQTARLDLAAKKEEQKDKGLKPQNGKIEVVDDFDFLEWLDKEKSKTTSMRKAKSKFVATDLIPWPEVDEVHDDGLIEIKLTNKVTFLPCSVCSESERRLLQADEKSEQEFWNEAVYKEYLVENKHISVELIPSSISSVDNLKFEWTLEELQVDKISIMLVFLFPELVSLYEEQDYVKIRFQNTYAFMEDSLGESTNILPSGYTVVSPLPRQKQINSIMVSEQDVIEQSSQTVVTAIPVLSFVFNLSMQQIWGSINSLQILAHLPIINFNIPSNIETHFDILVAIVTFDLFGFFIEGVNFGQTETEPFNEGLGALSYDSINILTNLFSMHIFVFYTLLSALFCFVIGMSICRIPNWRVCHCCRKAQDADIGENFAVQALRIFLTGFLEILICSYIGLGIFKLPGELSRVDWLAAFVNIFYIVGLFIFCVTMLWFVFCKSKKLQRIKATRDKLEYCKILKLLYKKQALVAACQENSLKSETESMMDSVRLMRSQFQKRSSGRDFRNENQLMQRALSRQISAVVARSNSTNEEIARKMQKSYDQARFSAVDVKSLDLQIVQLQEQVEANNVVYKRIKNSFTKFEIFYAGRKLNFSGQLESLIFIMRRVLFVASALYFDKEGHVFVAVGVFMIVSYLKLAYLLAAKPFESLIIVLTEAFNEFTILLFGYLAFELTNQSVPRDQILAIGSTMAYILYVAIAVNFSFLLCSFLVSIRNKVKAIAYARVLRSDQGRILIRKIEERGQNKLLQKIKERHRDPSNYDQFRIEVFACEIQPPDCEQEDPFNSIQSWGPQRQPDSLAGLEQTAAAQKYELGEDVKEVINRISKEQPKQDRYRSWVRQLAGRAAEYLEDCAEEARVNPGIDGLSWAYSSHSEQDLSHIQECDSQLESEQDSVANFQENSNRALFKRPRNFADSSSSHVDSSEDHEASFGACESHIQEANIVLALQNIKLPNIQGAQSRQTSLASEVSRTATAKEVRMQGRILSETANQSQSSEAKMQENFQDQGQGERGIQEDEVRIKFGESESL